VIYALEGLRGIAATLVALYHCWPTSIRNIPFILNGWLWVDLFFVLSGCVMAHAYDGKITKATQLKAFFIKRLGRLYPLHLVTTLSFMLIAVALPFIAITAKKLLGFSASSNFSGDINYTPEVWQRIWEQLPYHLTLTHGLNTIGELTLNVPSWSISTELAVYLLFALLWLFFSKIKNLQLPITILLCIASLLYLFQFGGKSNLGYMNDLGFWRCVAGFSIGTFIPKIWTRLRDKSLISFALPIQIAGLVLSTLVFVLAVKYPRLTYAAPFAFFILVLGIGAKETALTKLFSTKPLVALGTLSYSIYLWHVPLLLIFKPSAFLLPKWASELLVVVYLLTLLGIAKISYKYIEAPWRDRAADVAKRFASSSHTKMNVSH
jgi:peptidoglycan/LPS O-acetylase OafA/YrhL